MQHNPRDLFDEIPVTENDLLLWVAAVSPRWLEPERSFRLYVQSYNVAGKIRAAKANGTFEQIISRRPVPWFTSSCA